MAYIEFNANPIRKTIKDSIVCAVTTSLGEGWGGTYLGLVVKGYTMCDMPDAPNVWGAYLKDKGFERHTIPADSNYTVADFARQHPKGIYVLGIQNHAVCVMDGDWYGNWDSEKENPEYYWENKTEL